uniref:Uncharacterized protein n=1 Tax=Cacopsylla melanoneura TaxID=428564 RepID=A0A8D8ZCU7_9HEMI
MFTSLSLLLTSSFENIHRYSNRFIIFHEGCSKVFLIRFILKPKLKFTKNKQTQIVHKSNRKYSKLYISTEKFSSFLENDESFRMFLPQATFISLKRNILK